LSEDRRRVFQVARRQRDRVVGNRAVDPDPQVAHRAAERHHLRIIEQEPVEFAERDPAAGGHLENAAVAPRGLGDGVEGDRKRPGGPPVEVDRAHLDDARRGVGIELKGRVRLTPPGALVEAVEEPGFL
jgi:hypothetical protein